MDKREIKNQQKELSSLFNEWDPLEVYSQEVTDEYDCCVNPIIFKLHKGAKRDELVSFLHKHFEEHIGINTKTIQVEEFVDKVINWWKSKNSKISYS